MCYTYDFEYLFPRNLLSRLGSCVTAILKKLRLDTEYLQIGTEPLRNMLQIRPKSNSTLGKNGMYVKLKQIIAQILVNTLVENMLQATGM